MNYDKYAETLGAIKDMFLEIERLQRENAALRTQCETLTNRVSVLRKEAAIAKGSKPADIPLIYGMYLNELVRTGQMSYEEAKRLESTDSDIELAARQLLQDMEVPRTRKATESWDALRKAVAADDARTQPRSAK